MSTGCKAACPYECGCILWHDGARWHDFGILGGQGSMCPVPGVDGLAVLG